CGNAAPTPPGWAEATAAVAKMPANGDNVIKKVLEEIHNSAKSGEKKALQEYRDATAKRHKILSGMAPMWKELGKNAEHAGKSVSTVAALVVVLMEVAAGIFAMEMLGITSFFPKLDLLPSSRRRIILAVSLGGLLMLACIECSLAILREQIVESASALKHSLAGI